MKKKMPHFKSDEELEAFLDQDLTPYLHRGNFSDIQLVFEPLTKNLNLRVQESLIKDLKKRAKKFGMPYQRYVRQILMQAVASEPR
ncbi:MAG: CopG family antitoxin [Alphaproteobacteria bacterium]|nr:CopG family antitoxin [Alphaproteobacteria bacterium]